LDNEFFETSLYFEEILNWEEEEENTTEEDELEKESEEEKAESKLSIKTYKNVYKGHFSSKTIKGVNFYGPNSEFIISGSDDKRVYIWDKESTKLLTVLEGHRSIVNCTVGNPTQPMIASSGIDSVIKLWQNSDDYPSH